jgi:hypothetical protein
MRLLQILRCTCSDLRQHNPWLLRLVSQLVIKHARTFRLEFRLRLRLRFRAHDRLHLQRLGLGSRLLALSLGLGGGYGCEG